MSDSLLSLRRKIGSADDLESVVRTMKALSAAQMVQLEAAVQSLEQYAQTVELGLACWRLQIGAGMPPQRANPSAGVGALLFGSDQGLVGMFNESLLDFVQTTMGQQPARYIAVGERMQTQLLERGIEPVASLPVPASLAAVTSLVGELLAIVEAERAAGRIGSLHLFHNRPLGGTLYEHRQLQLLPLGEAWRQRPPRWPSGQIPQPIDGETATLRALIGEHLFIALFRAAAESMASENASRLAAMQRAEKNIDELLDTLKRSYHQLRQNDIDCELFDVLAGFEALHDVRG